MEERELDEIVFKAPLARPLSQAVAGDCLLVARDVGDEVLGEADRARCGWSRSVRGHKALHNVVIDRVPERTRCNDRWRSSLGAIQLFAYRPTLGAR
jgi:hypothetical protein